METNKIIDLNGKTISKMNLKDVYFKINKLTSDFIGKTIFTSILLFIAYLFYQLGYAFLYGFYFGGIDNKIGPANIMVNQIPFAIEYIAILGIFIFSIILLIIYLTYELVLTFGNLKKSVFVIFFTLFIYYLLCLFLSLTTSNIYLVGSDSEIYKSVFFLFYIIYSTLNTWRAFLNTFDNIFKGIILLFLI